MSLQQVSTMLNLRPSSGICAMMSSELKMGSRYSQDDWHFSMASKMSCTCTSVSSHCCRDAQRHRLRGLRYT
ncbi:Uncharacterized protein DAT39_022904, partial [Clarias magur]